MPTSKELEFIQKIHGKLLDYLIQNKDKKIHSMISIDDFLSEFNFSITESSDLKELEFFIDGYLDSSVDTSSPHFYNQLFSGFSTMGYLGEAITGLTNNSMYTYEMSPMATMMERALIEKMSKLIGYEDGFGSFVPGGSNANLIAVLCARNRAHPESKDNGLFDHSPLVGFVSEESHYSFLKAGYQVGIGVDNMRQVPCNADGRMDIGKLEAMIEGSFNDGEHPFFVGATAGTTVRGVFDPLDKIATICNKHDLWFHVDGSWGGSALLSRTHKTLLKGCEASDSFTWCAHKMMGIPLMCTAIILEDKTMLKRINSVPGTDYLFHGEDQEEMDLGIHSLQCGRRVDSLKLWLSWKYLGDDGYENRIEHLFSMAKYAESKVNDSDILQMLSPVESLNICFQVQPHALNDDKWDDLTILVRERLMESANIMVNYATIKDKTCIRLITVNFDLNTEHLDRFFDHVETLALELVDEMRV